MLLKFLAKYRDTGLLLMRVGLGVCYIIHGFPKLMGGPKTWTTIGHAMNNLGIDVFPMFWGFMAGFAEAIGGTLLILGFCYRPICLMLMFTMLVATLQLAGDRKTRDFKLYSHPLKMSFVFFGLAFAGPGRFSIDKD